MKYKVVINGTEFDFDCDELIVYRCDGSLCDMVYSFDEDEEVE